MSQAPKDNVVSPGDDPDSAGRKSEQGTCKTCCKNLLDTCTSKPCWKKLKTYCKVEIMANFIILILTVLIILMMVGEAVLTFSGQLIKKEKTCDLKEALQSLSINVQCKYSDVENCLENIYGTSISSMFFDGILLIYGMILVFKKIPDKQSRLVLAIYFLLIILLGLGYGIKFLDTETQIVNSKTGQTTVNYTQIKINMEQSLNQYTSDVITNSDTISDKWNRFFIKYDCCAVTQVTGTTNEFDTTPWCTTSGSCQQTNSQIPKTCCKDVTEGDYMNAAASCHSTVTSGTYKDSCFSTIISLEVEIMTESEVILFSTALITTGALKVISALSILAVCIAFNIILYKYRNEASKPAEKTKNFE